MRRPSDPATSSFAREILYQCPLEEDLLGLLPRGESEGRDGKLVPAPEIRFHRPPQPPDDIDPRLAMLEERAAFWEHFAKDHPIVWVTDPGTKMVAPYWLSGSLDPLVRKTVQTGEVDGGLSAERRTLLRHAGILLSRGEAGERARRWTKQCDDVRKSLRNERYSILRGVLPPLFLAGLRRHYRAIERAGYFWEDEDPVFQRSLVYNEPVSRFIHHQLAPVLSDVADGEVIPSFRMVSKYREGAVLRRHVDRPQCVWNLSMVLDMDPEPDLEGVWPIYLETPRRIVEMKLGVGDAVIYSGTDIPHWRDALSAGCKVTVGFFHFVPYDFGGSTR